MDLSRVSDGPKCGGCAESLRFDRPVPTDPEDLARTVRDAEAPVLVDFYADWCGPCTMMAPILDEFSRKHHGAILVLKADTERHQELVRQYGVRGIPTVILFREGREAGRHVGLARLADLERIAGLG